MKIKSVTLHNFRCFGETPVTIELADDLTALVGANGSGKTAVLHALARLFGPTQSLRTIRYSDFHNPSGASSGQRSDTELSIEIILTFPELADDNSPEDAVPALFNHMCVVSPSGELACRLKLEANWTDDGTVEGNVEQNLYWLLTAENPVPEDKKKRVSPTDRGRIQVHYIGANRDPATEFRRAASSRAGRLVRAISWEQDTREAVSDASDTIRKTLGSEQAVSVINSRIQRRWRALRDEYASASTELRFAGSGFDEIIRDVGVVFPEDDGRENDLSVLSEGQQSLFYLALVAAVFDLEGQIVGQTRGKSVNDPASDGATNNMDNLETETSGFKTDRFSLIPELTIFALEEPENHLAPHYLARIIELLRSLTRTGRAQAMFSSHSPSILQRILPEEIRHLRRDMHSLTSIVRNITLPNSAEASSKYVREAVMAYPELYFGKFVILAEGPTEELVLPKIASASGLEVDTSFICVVPLGGRHVNHFWRLLKDLQIPYATLLDLDLGRWTGGWARIKYVCEQLLKNGTDASDLLEFEHEGQTYRISREDLQDLHKRKLEDFDLPRWTHHLENYGVFFSTPLDLDLSMLSRFPDAYKNTDGHIGPVIPARDTPDWSTYIRRAVEVAVGNDEEAIGLYMKSSCDYLELFPWYRYLFLSRSKPATHIQALAEIEESALSEKVPPSLLRLLDHCREAIAH